MDQKTIHSKSLFWNPVSMFMIQTQRISVTTCARIMDGREPQTTNWDVTRGFRPQRNTIWTSITKLEDTKFVFVRKLSLPFVDVLLIHQVKIEVCRHMSLLVRRWTFRVKKDQRNRLAQYETSLNNSELDNRVMRRVCLPNKGAGSIVSSCDPAGWNTASRSDIWSLFLPDAIRGKSLFAALRSEWRGGGGGWRHEELEVEMELKVLVSLLPLTSLHFYLQLRDLRSSFIQSFRHCNKEESSQNTVGWQAALTCSITNTNRWEFSGKYCCLVAKAPNYNTEFMFGVMNETIRRTWPRCFQFTTTKQSKAKPGSGVYSSGANGLHGQPRAASIFGF